MDVPYRFVEQVDDKLFEATSAVWRDQITRDPENTSASFYEGCLDHCEGAVSGKIFADGRGCLSAVEIGDDGFASALIVMSYAKHRDSLRMLNVYVRPDLNAADRKPNIPALAWIAATAIVGCLQLTYKTYPCSELKLLAHWPLDSEFLTAVTTALMGDPEFEDQFTVEFHGNWIVLTKARHDSCAN